MNRSLSRRRLLQGTLAAGALSAAGAGHSSGEKSGKEATQEPLTLGSETIAPPEAFPGQDPSRVYDTVFWAHSDIDKVAQSVEGSPALANAAIDWGFGDWESALGAASHMGRHDMAELLIKHGARPDLFSHAMTGHVDTVRAIIEAMPGIQSTYGPHGITLLSHAKAGKEQAAAVVAYLEEVGGADPQQTSKPLELPVEAYVGRYAWRGDGEPPSVEGNTVEVITRNDMLALVRGEGFPRRLWHQGDHVFAPFGNGSLTVRFDVAEQQATRLSVWDPGQIMSARRVYGGHIDE